MYGQDGLDFFLLSARGPGHLSDLKGGSLWSPSRCVVSFQVCGLPLAVHVQGSSSAQRAAQQVWLCCSMHAACLAEACLAQGVVSPTPQVPRSPAVRLPSPSASNSVSRQAITSCMGLLHGAVSRCPVQESRLRTARAWRLPPQQRAPHPSAHLAAALAAWGPSHALRTWVASAMKQRGRMVDGRSSGAATLGLATAKVRAALGLR